MIYAWHTIHPAPTHPPATSGLAGTELAARHAAELVMGPGALAYVAAIDYAGGCFVQNGPAMLGVRPNAGRDVQWWNGRAWQ